MSSGPTTGPVLADVVLRDGSTMRFRPPGQADAGGLLEFFRSLSDESLYRRFHGRPAVAPRIVEPVLEPDWVDRGALVGLKGERIVAVANYVRLRDPRAAEVAFAVADELQGRGIATRLLEQLAAAASAAMRIDCCADGGTSSTSSAKFVGLPKTPDVKRPTGPTFLEQSRAALNNHSNNSKERKSRHELEKSVGPIVTCLS